MTRQQALNLITQAEEENSARYKEIEAIAFANQERVLNAFRDNKVALRHFSGSTGYSYEDEGKHVLSKVFADSFYAESGIVSPLIASGTHAITVALFGVLRPSNTIVSITGMPYDTLIPVVTGEGNGSLKDFNIDFISVPLDSNGKIDNKAVKSTIKNKKPTAVFIQRSRGYTWRNSLTIQEIKQAVELVKKESPDTIVLVDNCYGEFVEELEPTAVGADIIIGSLIKNPGGGIAPTGGYICGKKHLIEQIANRLTAPGVGVEVGSYTGGYRDYFQGLFLASHTTAEALKGALLFRTIYTKLGFSVKPAKNDTMSDIICSIRFDDSQKMLNFCKSIQAVSPVDSFASPEPWDMPGYKDKVVMAAGSFIQGASIELSCDGPMRPPYIAYLQGALNYAHARLAVMHTLMAHTDK